MARSVTSGAEDTHLGRSAYGSDISWGRSRADWAATETWISSSSLENWDTGCSVRARGALITIGSFFHQGPSASFSLFHSGTFLTLFPILLHWTELVEKELVALTGSAEINLDILREENIVSV